MSKSRGLVLCTIGMLLVLSTLPVATAQSDDAETPASITRIMMLPPEAEVTSGGLGKWSMCPFCLTKRSAPSRKAYAAAMA